MVGIATGGSAPILARDIRARVEAVLLPGLDLLAGLAREVRDTVKASIPDFLTRRRFWEKALRGRTADLAAKGQAAEARREILRYLNTDEAPRGVVHIVGAGPGDPELLTLKALRWLQEWPPRAMRESVARAASEDAPIPLPAPGDTSQGD